MEKNEVAKVGHNRLAENVESTEVVKKHKGWFMKGNTYGTGRPPMYLDASELAEAINSYFNNVPTRSVVVGKGEYQHTVEIPCPTISGLALYLGFDCRSSFYDYENKDKSFNYVIKQARLWIESEYEKALTVGNTTGAIFALKNFGWIDRQEIEHINNAEPIVINFNTALLDGSGTVQLK